jgi:hypothetical protein
MILSQTMEAFSGPSIPGIAINMAAFALFGIGIWGLHQKPPCKPRWCVFISILSWRLPSLNVHDCDQTFKAGSLELAIETY